VGALSVSSLAIGLYEAGKTATEVKDLTARMIEAMEREYDKKQIGTGYYNLMNWGK
jgi:hypothetical protein